MSEPMRLRARVGAPARAVWDALTSPEAMKVWFAEHADVNLPDQYEFWGRYTPEGDRPRQRVVHAESHTLRFEWLGTTVEISLAGRGNETVVTLRQTDLPDWAATLVQDGPLTLMHTFWALSIANLVDYAEGRQITGRVDLTSTDLRTEQLIGASPDEVFESLVDPETFGKWFGARLQIEHFTGGRWSMAGFDNDPSPAKILEFDRGGKLAIEWPDGLVSTWELEDAGGKTRLTVVQSGFLPDGRPGYGSWIGWMGGFAELRRWHELAGWRSLWLEVSLDGTPDGMITIGTQEA